MTVLAGLHVAQIYAFRQQAPTRAGFHVKEFVDRAQGCSSSSLLRSENPSNITWLSFTALDWPSTTFPPTPSSLSQGVGYLGPGALLDDDSAPSCFAFSGDSGGAFLVSEFEKYTITQFTLDNTVVDTVVDSIHYPKEGALWGLFEGPLPEGLKNVTTSFVAEHIVYVVIGSFCFSPEHGPAQTFIIDSSIASFPAVQFSVFYLEVSSNWGGSYTCLGRIRLHGSP